MLHATIDAKIDIQTLDNHIDLITGQGRDYPAAIQ